MSERKKSTATKPAAPPPPAPAAALAPIAPAPAPISNTLMINRVANGFVADVHLPTDDYGRSREKRVARTPVELGNIVADWATPTPKKR